MVLIISPTSTAYLKRKKVVHQKNSEKAIVTEAGFLSDDTFKKNNSNLFIIKHPGWNGRDAELMGTFFIWFFRPNVIEA